MYEIISIVLYSTGQSRIEEAYRTKLYELASQSLRYEKKLVHLEQPVPPPLEPETADHEAIAAYYDLVNAQQEVACLMLANMSLGLQKTLESYNAYDMLQELKLCSKSKQNRNFLKQLKHSMLENGRMNYEQFIQNYNMHSIEKIIVGLHDMLKLTKKCKLKEAATHVVLVIRVCKIEKDKNKPRGYKGKGYINKKRIEKLQHDRILQPTIDESFDKCKSCISGKMARKPFPHQIERSKDLLGLIHTDICGPLELCQEKGCKALVKRDTPDKLDSKSIKCIFVGYLKETICYYFYYLLENKIFVARNAKFFESSLTLHEASGSNIDLEIFQEENTQPYENTSEQHDEVVHDDFEPRSEIVPICGSNRIPQAPNQYGFYVDAKEHELGDLIEPPNYKATLTDPESDK
ncbi:hypothetical protein Tco_1403424 [Tanacetum coccineum]